jgi:hypothetical protein
MNINYSFSLWLVNDTQFNIPIYHYVIEAAGYVTLDA